MFVPRQNIHNQDVIAIDRNDSTLTHYFIAVNNTYKWPYTK